MQQELTIETLSDRNSILSIVMDYLFDGVYIVDQDRKILFWNKGAESITGYSHEEVQGRCCSEDILNHIDENGKLLCQYGCPLTETLATGENVSAKVFPMHKSGNRFPVYTHVAPIRNSKNEIIAAIEVFQDATNTERLKVLQEKFNDLIRRYVSETTLEAALESARSGETERTRLRELTILYLDIVAFTSFSEKNEPDVVVKMLNDVFAVCCLIIREEGGDVDKFIGDGIMSVFADPDSAVRAAVKMLEMLGELNEGKRAGDGSDPINIRIGINTGLVLQGDIGSPDRKDLTIIGDAVNVASRIQSQAKPNSVNISDATLSRLSDQSMFDFVGDVTVKNRVEPVGIYRRIAE